MNKNERSIRGIKPAGTEYLPANLLCFSHLRWNFVYQRPQHILTWFSKLFNVYFFEEPLVTDTGNPFLSVSKRDAKLWVLTPHIPAGLDQQEETKIQKNLLNNFLKFRDLSDFAFWYYTPMALTFSARHQPKVVIYDCMDELSAFKSAPAHIKEQEELLFKIADIVFTGGYSLYEAKKKKHNNIFPFPSSIDRDHFAEARKDCITPKDQANIPKPRIGFFGVIDERFDTDLIKGIAEARPDWQIVLIGPVVKISRDILPKNKNIHYLGQRDYKELPSYLSGWDAALIPFLLNEATRFISPTKTPEYLAAGIPVISTPIRDVVHPYGENGMVHIGYNTKDFIKAIEKELISGKDEWLAQVDEFLVQNSWDLTCKKMMTQIKKTVLGYQEEKRISISIA